MRIRKLSMGAAALLLAGVVSASAGEGLTCKLVNMEVTHKYGEREIKRKSLVFEIKNSGEKTVLVPASLRPTLSAKDGEGQDVPTRKLLSRRGRRFGLAATGSSDAKNKDEPVSVTILKPGQTLTIRCNIYSLQFPEKGTYKLTATFENKSDDKEVLPGMKLWSGTLKSDELDYEVTRVYKRKTPTKLGRDKRKPGKKKTDEKEKGAE